MNTATLCECCERERGDEADWKIDQEGNDYCPECFDSLREALLMMVDKLPLRIGLCPACAPEFYYPLTDGEGLGCPTCGLEMVVYVRSRLPEGYQRGASFVPSLEIARKFKSEFGKWYGRSITRRYDYLNKERHDR